MNILTFESDGTNGYLIVLNGRSLLIDCPALDMADRIRAAGAPLPEVILHTQVQEEHCREWASLPQAAVHVYEPSGEVARRSPEFFRDCQTVWGPDRAWSPDDAGMEKYTLAGCVTERPPRQPLNVAGVLKAGQTFRWQGVELEVIALAGCGRRAVGLYWRQEGVLFCGDLMRSGGYVVNLYDIERAYGPYIGWRELNGSLQRVIALSPRRALPSTGPVITEPAADARRLMDRMDRVLAPAARTAPPRHRQPLREFGMFKQVHEGVYQSILPGNMILYVDGQGRGLCLDPDVCVWRDWETNCRTMNEQLDLLEREAGLKRIERALITHYHGDHMQYAPLLRERYGTEVSAAADVAALLSRPREFPYPCMLHWYAFPYDHFDVDRRLAYQETVLWHDVPVTPIHMPGHAWAQTGYLIPWRGLKTVCTGDTLQYTEGEISVPLPVMYNDTAWPQRSLLVTVKKLLELRPDLVLGGHGNYFFDPDGAIVRTWRTAADDAIARAGELVHDGDLMRAMTPPGYNEARGRLNA